MRFKRQCKKCEEEFQPTGKTQQYCEECQYDLKYRKVNQNRIPHLRKKYKTGTDIILNRLRYRIAYLRRELNIAIDKREEYLGERDEEKKHENAKPMLRK